MQLFPEPETQRSEPVWRFVRAAAPLRWPWQVRWVIRACVLLAAFAGTALALDANAERIAQPVWEAARQSVEVELRLPQAEEFGPLAQRSHVVTEEGVHLATLHGEENRRLTALDELPDHAWQAVLVAEDRRFFEHEGYDVWATIRAALENLRTRDIVQGGSTITQQLAKTFVGDDVTFARKYDELLLAQSLEREFDKHELLDRYLNEVYFGGGAYGIHAAAGEFFGVAGTELRPEQSALLAGLIRSPERLNPRRNPEGALARRDVVLAGMAEEGYLDRDSVATLQSLPLGTFPAREPVQSDPHVVEAVKQEFLANPAFGETWTERAELLFSGGIVIETTIDPGLQRRTEHLIRSALSADGITAAIAAVDPRTGRVLAATSGRAFEEEQYNLALQGRRQPGSAFKTFTLTAALEEGLPLSTTLEGQSGTTFGTETTTGDWATRGVRNFAGASYTDLTARQALIRSVNTAFADLVLRVGTPAMLSVTDRLGISRAAFGGLENPGIALGGLDRGVTPLEMASAYGAFATGGEHAEPFLIESVTDLDGNELYAAAPERERVLAPDVSAVVRNVLEEVVRSGTGVRAQLDGWPVAGKTGTSQDLTDVWFVGVTPQLSAAVWVGNPDSRQPLHGMSSSGTAAPLWHAFMQQALGGSTPEPFPDAGQALPDTLLGPEEPPESEDSLEAAP